MDFLTGTCHKLARSTPGPACSKSTGDRLPAGVSSHSDSPCAPRFGTYILAGQSAQSWKRRTRSGPSPPLQSCEKQRRLRFDPVRLEVLPL